MHEPMRVNARKQLGASVIQWTGDNLEAVQAFMRPESPLLTGTMEAMGIYASGNLTYIDKGEWIVKWDDGRFEVGGEEKLRSLFDMPSADATGSPA